MFQNIDHHACDRAFQSRDFRYDGLLYTGVKTTDIFCRPSCSAQKPKLENCEHFSTAQDALLAGYRSCKRCHPLSHFSSELNVVIAAVEASPQHRWKEPDFRALPGYGAALSRQLKKHTGMTCVAYARARRLGLALKHIRSGKFRVSHEDKLPGLDVFSDILGTLSAAQYHQELKAEWIDTPLGPMIAIADDSALYLLEFTDRRGLEREVERLRKRHKARIIPGRTAITTSIEDELRDYFAGDLRTFKTPLADFGSDFQKSIWKALQDVPFGTTSTYAELAKQVGKPDAFRATGRANGANQLAIIVPCHRILSTQGELVGYGGGIERKKWLIDHEKRAAR